MRAHTARQRESEKLRAVEAFTLIEMLMVIAIIAAITVIGLPSLRGLGRSNVVTSATQQLVDDLMLARHKAIVNRTTVHVVFVPSSIKNSPAPRGVEPTGPCIVGEIAWRSVYDLRVVRRTKSRRSARAAKRSVSD